MPQRITITRDWKDESFVYKATYEESKVYCPNCGLQTVWIRGDGDYYLGQCGYCTSCGKSHHNCNDFYDIDSVELQRLKDATATKQVENLTP